MQKKVSVKRLLWIFFALVATVGFDQLTKVIALRSLKFQVPMSFLGDSFRLQYAENTGAFLSLGAQLPPAIKFFVFTVLVGAILFVCFWQLMFPKTESKLSAIALLLTVSGGLSNLLDRIWRPNSGVIDFMNIGIGRLRTGIFNVADVEIMVGIGLLIYQMSREPDEKSDQK